MVLGNSGRKGYIFFSFLIYIKLLVWYKYGYQWVGFQRVGVHRQLHAAAGSSVVAIQRSGNGYLALVALNRADAIQPDNFTVTVHTAAGHIKEHTV